MNKQASSNGPVRKCACERRLKSTEKKVLSIRVIDRRRQCRQEWKERERGEEEKCRNNHHLYVGPV